MKNKFILAVLALHTFLPIACMENKDINQNNTEEAEETMITVICSDDAKVPVSLSILKVSETIKDMLEDSEFSDTFFIPNITGKSFKYLLSYLENLHDIKHKSGTAQQTIQKIKDKLEKESLDRLITLYCNANFLALPDLFLNFCYETIANKLIEPEQLNFFIKDLDSFQEEYINKLPHELQSLIKNYLLESVLKPIDEYNFSCLPKIKLENHTRELTSVVFSNNGLVATASKDGTVCIYKPNDGKPELFQTLDDHDEWVNTLAFSSNNRYLASTGENGTIYLYEFNGERFTPLIKFTAEKDVLIPIAFSIDNTHFAFAADSKISIYALNDIFALKDQNFNDRNVEPVKILDNLDGGYWLNSATPDSNNACFIFISDDNIITPYSFNGDTIEPILDMEPTKHDYISSIGYSSDKTYLATGSTEDNSLNLYNVDGTQEQPLKLITSLNAGSVTALAFGSNNYIAYALGTDIYICKLNKNEEPTLVHKLFGDHTDNITSIAFSNNNYLASASADYTLSLYNIGLVQETLNFLQSKKCSLEQILFLHSILLHKSNPEVLVLENYLENSLFTSLTPNIQEAFQIQETFSEFFIQELLNEFSENK